MHTLLILEILLRLNSKARSAVCKTFVNNISNADGVSRHRVVIIALLLNMPARNKARDCQIVKKITRRFDPYGIVEMASKIQKRP